MSQTFEIAPAQPRDFLAIAELDRMVWAEQPFIVDGEHAWRLWCEHATVLVARDASTEVANLFGVLLCFPGCGEVDLLHKIFVHPDHRGKRIASELMAGCLQAAARPIILTVDPANEHALRTYERFGFERDQHVPGFYRPDEDRYVMKWTPRRADAPP